MSQPLTCPKCRSEMHSYERNRVLVDQCTGCGGIFLDKGELESLAAAENAWHSGGAAPGAAAAPGAGVPQQQSYAQGYPPARSHATSDSRYVQQYPQAQRYASSRDRYGNGYGYKRKSKGSFLGDLFG
ncbi:zf-TFIIB domain-containing protein [Dermacoccaceae bacterium W4C1]